MMTLPFYIKEERTWQEAISESGSILNGFFVSLRRIFPNLRYFWVREVGKKSNMVHFHVMISCFLPQRIISRLWEHAGGGSVVDIRLTGMTYALKYLAKFPEYPSDVWAALRGKRKWSCTRKLLIPLVKISSEGIFTTGSPWQWYGVVVEEVVNGIVYFREQGG